MLCRFAIQKFGHLVEDFEQFIRAVVEPWRNQQSPTPPLFFAGASMGGLVVRSLTARDTPMRASQHDLQYNWLSNNERTHDEDILE
jgi:alpha-beta hydrolase superfamily lysophospholipase